MNLEDGLKIASGVFWTLTYIILIIRGFQDKTYGMPLAALCANISWEFMFAFLFPHRPPQLYINVVWFLFDTVIVYQYLRYGPASFPANLSPKLFIPTFLLALVVAFGAVLSISYELSDWDGKYAAFGQNLMMSILFVTMLVQRNSVVGQSLYAAIFKLLGTLFPSILFSMRYPQSILLHFLFVSIFVFDALYVGMLYRKYRERGLTPWLLHAQFQTSEDISGGTYGR